MQTATKNHHPLPTGAYRLVNHKGELLGVRVEYNGRYYDMDIDCVKGLFHGDLTKILLLPYMVLREMSGRLYTKDEFDEAYSVTDVSGFIEDNLTPLLSMSVNSLRQGNHHADFIAKFATVRSLVDVIRESKGFSGSIMRSVDGVGVLIGDMVVVYNSSKSEYEFKAQIHVAIPPTQGGLTDNSARNELLRTLWATGTDFSHVYSTAKSIVTVEIGLLDFEKLILNHANRVFLNTLFPTITGVNKDGVRDTVVSATGSFTLAQGELSFGMSKDSRLRAYKKDPDMFDALSNAIQKLEPVVSYLTRNDNLLLDVTSAHLASGRLEVQPLKKKR